MNSLISFVKMDLMLVKPNMTLKNIILVLGISCFLSFGAQNNVMMISMIMMYGAMFSMYPFIACDRNRIDFLYHLIPIDNKNIVIGRYLFSLIMNFLSGSLAFAVTIILNLIFQYPTNIMNLLFVIVVCFMSFSFVQFFQIPINFKLGYNKAKSAVFLPLLIFPMITLIMLSMIGKDTALPFVTILVNYILSNTILFISILLFLWVIVLVGSVILSICFYRKREFC